MKPGYRRWLEEQKYDAGTINAQMYRAGRVEEHHGNLDEHYANDRLASLTDSLRYSTTTNGTIAGIRVRFRSRAILETTWLPTGMRSSGTGSSEMARATQRAYRR